MAYVWRFWHPKSIWLGASDNHFRVFAYLIALLEGRFGVFAYLIALLEGRFGVFAYLIALLEGRFGVFAYLIALLEGRFSDFAPSRCHSSLSSNTNGIWTPKVSPDAIRLRAPIRMASGRQKSPPRGGLEVVWK